MAVAVAVWLCDCGCVTVAVMALLCGLQIQGEVKLLDIMISEAKKPPKPKTPPPPEPKEEKKGKKGKVLSYGVLNSHCATPPQTG